MKNCHATTFWTVKKQILVTTLALVVGLVSVGVYSLVKLNGLKTSVDFLAKDAVPGIIAISSVNAHLSEAHVLAWRLTAVKSAAEIAAIEKDMETYRAEISAGLESYEKTITLAQDRELFAKLLAARGVYTKQREQLVALVGAGDFAKANAFLTAELRDAYRNYLAATDVLVEFNAGNAHATATSADATVSKALLQIATATVALAVFGLAAAVVISGRLSSKLGGLAAELSAGATQTASASTQVAGASEQLAEGASEQAAAVEETSASLEEIGSMTRQNASHAIEANTLMQEMCSVVQAAHESMVALVDQMRQISRSSAETQKIVKTIDEIAFQTNILALNAAVEAARAGEAGAGFAVVADEVRNLAQRAAEASRSTSQMIEGSVSTIQSGVALAEGANGAFTKVEASAGKVGGLVAEIAAASQEQTKGVEQINRAVAEMDKVTQRTASNAEESAASAEELSSQAARTLEIVNELMRLVGGVSAVHAQQPEESLGPVVVERARPRAGLNSGTKAKPGVAPVRGAKVLDGKGEDFVDISRPLRLAGTSARSSS